MGLVHAFERGIFVFAGLATASPTEVYLEYSWIYTTEIFAEIVNS